MESRIKKLENKVEQLEKELLLKQKSDLRSHQVKFKVMNVSGEGNTLFIKIRNKWEKLFSFSSSKIIFGKSVTFRKSIRALKGSIYASSTSRRGLVIPTKKPPRPVQGSLCINPSAVNEVIQYNGTAWKRVMDGNDPT